MRTNEENIAIFEELLRSTQREGMESLMAKFLQKTDFYSAPASIMNYNAFPGGLVQHSLDVYERMKTQAENPNTILGKLKEEGKVSDDSIIIVALLHDLYKANRYAGTEKNVRTYDIDQVEELRMMAPQEVKRDANGEYVWTKVMGYQKDDQFPIGTAEKSIIFLQKYIDLKWDEIIAIRWANGSQGSEYNDFAWAARKYPLSMALYEAKMEAMFFDAE